MWRKSQNWNSGNLLQRPWSNWAQLTEPAWLGGQDWTKSAASSPSWKPAWVPAGKHFMRTLEKKLQLLVCGSSSEGGTQLSTAFLQCGWMHTYCLYHHPEQTKPNIPCTQSGTPDKKAPVCTRPLKVSRTNKSSDSWCCPWFLDNTKEKEQGWQHTA